MVRNITVVVLLAVSGAVFAEQSVTPLPAVDNYNISIDLDPKNNAGKFVADVQIRNVGKGPLSEVPLLLYRLFAVDAAEYQGKPATFDQAVVTDRDDTTLQVNMVRVKLAPALAAGNSAVVRLSYEGELHGYREVWRYVQDTIAPEYSLLRLDTFFYPVVSLPTRESRLGGEAHFTYRVTACVPDGLTVATGGRVSATTARDGKPCTEFTSLQPTRRIDVAAAKFSIQTDPSRDLRAYVLPGHEEGAKRVLDAMRRASEYFTEMFGPPATSGYTAIEIPNGWGSQASDSYFLQSAAAFEDPKRIGEVYHELGHGFDIEPAATVKRARFFDEAFASYYESLAVAHFEGKVGGLEREMHESRELFNQWADHDKKYALTPIAEYGRHELGQMSYSKGAYALYVLHQLIGDQKFRDLIRQLRRESAAQPMDFQRLQQTTQRVAQRDVTLFFDEWFYGSTSSELLRSTVPADAIVARYR